MRTATAMRINGRMEGLGTSGAAERLAGHDLRAKIYAAISALGFEPAPEGLTPEDLVLLVAVEQFAELCSAEAWSDVRI